MFFIGIDHSVKNVNIMEPFHCTKGFFIKMQFKNILLIIKLFFTLRKKIVILRINCWKVHCRTQRTFQLYGNAVKKKKKPFRTIFKCETIICREELTEDGLLNFVVISRPKTCFALW